MKKMLCFFFLVIAATSFAWELKTGTYDLYGTNVDGSSFRGQVVIAPQGDNYSLTWYIGSHQAQVGVGIHRSWEDVFSVAFADLSRGYWGTISYKADVWGNLEGAWATSSGVRQGSETLRWVSYVY